MLLMLPRTPALVVLEYVGNAWYVVGTCGIGGYGSGGVGCAVACGVGGYVCGGVGCGVGGYVSACVGCGVAAWAVPSPAVSEDTLVVLWCRRIREWWRGLWRCLRCRRIR
eukprot:TRINITY_DN11522_c0_g1_i16.p1 TRINITY_DN11522_c0_g1~~TRINITY_DN11522_c0_g1_i16.p1  ORF type:complete len:110 (-),score=3.69 TRINITY_DN11522_c0_g1_i16:189-518(-)